MNKQLDDILQKRMDRKDFLKHVGMGVVVLTGLAGVVKFLQPQSKKESSTSAVASGYGASVYGGHGAMSAPKA